MANWIMPQTQYTRDVASVAVPCVQKVLSDVGYRVIKRERTPGAVGYTRITYVKVV